MSDKAAGKDIEFRSPSNPVKSWLEYSQIHVGLVAATLSSATFLIAGGSPDRFVVGLCVLGSILVYIIDRVNPELSDEQNHPQRTAWFRSNRSVLLFAIVLLAIGAAFLMTKVNSRQLAVAIVLAVAGLGYALPPRLFKSVAILKPFVIAFVWSIGVVVLPLLGTETATLQIVLLGAYRFAYLIPNTILSDVPDLKGDESVGVQTPASILALKPMIVAVICAIVGTVGLGAALVGTGMSFVLILVDLAGMLLFLPFLVVKDITPRMKFLLDSALLWPMVLFLVA